MSKALDIPVPEMIFGDNLVAVEHLPSGCKIAFNAFDALDAVGKDGKNMLQVSYAKDWARTREGCGTADVKEVVKPYDWSYSSTYSGTLSGEKTLEPTEKQIPLDLLKRRDPILFFDEVVLYESELDDNGVSVFSVKVRVHEERMLLLARLFVRVDNVIVRVRDTRVFVEFGKGEILREYTAKEESFANVKNVSVFFFGLEVGRVHIDLWNELTCPVRLSRHFSCPDGYQMISRLR
jgi:type 2A phosphatase activator TIP41